MSLLETISKSLEGVDPTDDGQVKELFTYIKDQVYKTGIGECRDTLTSMIIAKTLDGFIIPCRELMDKINSKK